MDHFKKLALGLTLLFVFMWLALPERAADRTIEIMENGNRVFGGGDALLMIIVAAGIIMTMWWVKT